MAYKDIVPVGTALIIGATSFGLGVVYGNLPYDLQTLWSYNESAFEQSLAHYKVWATTPRYVHHILHFVMALGLTGCFIKLYKPVEDAKYFEYGCLGLMMVGIIIYLTNLRIGMFSCISGEWGEVEMPTGINVLAASQVMIVVVLVGVLVMQGGLYYAEWYDAKLKAEFYEQEAEGKNADVETVKEVQETGSTATEKPKTRPKRKTKKAN